MRTKLLVVLAGRECFSQRFRCGRITRLPRNSTGSRLLQGIVTNGNPSIRTPDPFGCKRPDGRLPLGWWKVAAPIFCSAMAAEGILAGRHRNHRRNIAPKTARIVR
jgi:hypothetical protein